MHYQQKLTLLGMVGSLACVLGYGIFAGTAVQERGQALLADLGFWAGAMLLTMAIGLAFHILLHLGFFVFRAGAAARAQERGDEERPLEEPQDEMDRLVALKAARGPLLLLVGGFVAMLAAFYARLPAGLALNLLFAAFGLGPLLAGVLRLRYYRRGFVHG